ncbi:MAG: SDR family NAD(P)-dependent oxidoreductase [Alphaproteobacteria bacterium]|nr:SDR family NAD(P)-dependent oxidoreductase [Alphaproteobacteria bacterium]
MELRLDGKAALITGGSKGLGLDMAKAFAKAGGDVAILARNPDTLEAAKASIQALSKGKVSAVACDVAKAADVKRAYDQVMKDLGKIDILINNAGQSQTGKFLELTDEVWQADLDLKLFAAIRLARLVMPQMQQRKWGRIINVLNIGAKAPAAASAPTSVSRAAGLALTKMLANENAPHNVLVNALHVGIIVSDQVARQHKAAGTNASLEDFIAEKGKAVPMGRMGRGEEFANTALFLCAENGGSYVTGASINVDGGRSPVW